MSKAITFGGILLTVMTLLYCFLDSNSGHLKDLEFRLIVPLLACLILLLSSFVIKDGHNKDDDWEPL